MKVQQMSNNSSVIVCVSKIGVSFGVTGAKRHRKGNFRNQCVQTIRAHRVGDVIVDYLEMDLPQGGVDNRQTTCVTFQ